MKRVYDRKAFFRTVVVAALVALAVWAIMAPRSTSAKQVSLKALGLENFVASEITYDGVMHELYWHYEFANQMIRVGRITDAKAHLRVMSFYINLMPMLKGLRDKKFFQNEQSRKKFDSYAMNLLNNIEKTRKQLGSGNPVELGKQLEKNVSAMCNHCHDKLREPIRDITPYGKKIVLGKGTKKVKK